LPCVLILSRKYYVHADKGTDDRKKRKALSLLEKAKVLDKLNRGIRIAAFLHLMV
jgi:hypothetical protein